MYNKLNIQDKVTRMVLKKGEKVKLLGVTVVFTPFDNKFSIVIDKYECKNYAVLYEFKGVKKLAFSDNKLVFEIIAECEKRIVQSIDIKQILLGLFDLLSGGEKVSLIEIKEYIDNNYTSKITLDELAEMFYLSKYYLVRLFKNQNGITPINYLIEKRIEYAKTLLLNTQLSVKELADKCGFDDYVYFSKIFKDRTGYSPTHFRTKHK